MLFSDDWFAGDNDSASLQLGAGLEMRIENALANAGISYRKTKGAGFTAGLDPPPDFIVPGEFNPRIVIAAAIAEDEEAARDTIDRVEHFAQISRQGQPDGLYKFEVIACICGRGFGIRREGIKQLLMATRGKLFTLSTLDRLIECTSLREFTAK